jgi:hypothetical protein
MAETFCKEQEVLANVSTEPLPGNERAIFTEQLPSNDSTIHSHSHTQAAT